MKQVFRVFAVAMGATAVVTCADQATTVGRSAYARIALAPLFATAPAGGPSIDVESVHGVLKNGNDSSVADALVEGDSAVLEFEQVVVHGDSVKYELAVQAFDPNNTLVFEGTQDVQVKPGDNTPASPSLDYAAPDTGVTSIDISATALALSWLGGDTASSVNRACLNKVPSASTSNTKQQLTIIGKTAANVTVPNVHVGWTSRDTTAFTVDGLGMVRSRCSNKSAWLVARTFKDVPDSILVTVTAPAFSLVMSPDSASVRRGSTQQLAAFVSDETGGQVPASLVTWFSSDTTRAKVSATGLVTAFSNGRVLMTASSGGRTTVGVVQVIRPLAAKVVVQPAVALDSLGRNQSRFYFAKALDAANRVIPDASGFVWSSTNASVLSVNSTSGLATSATSTGNADVIATLDSKADTLSVVVLTALPPGSIKGKVTDAATGLPLGGVLLTGPSSNFTTLADGLFTLGNLQNGDDVTLTRTTPSSYVTITAYSVPAFPNKVLEVPAVPMSPTGGTGTMTGTVRNALSGSVVSGVTVNAFTGVNGGPTPKRPVVTPAFTTTTNASGVFTFAGAPAGVYTLLFSASGYSDRIGGSNAVGGQTKTTADILMAPSAAGSGLFIVLTWADCPATNVPCDLDAHLTGPLVTDTTQRFQVFRGSLRYVSGTDTIAALDVDDDNGRGPEVIGLRPAATVGTYRFYVHNATLGTGANKALADSASARVDVYQDGHPIGTFFPPAGESGNVWNVFNYDGARLIPVGTISTEANPLILSVKAAAADKKKRQ